MRGYDAVLVEAFGRFCLESGRGLGAHVPGARSVPVETSRWSVLSSPHVHKTAWTQLERRTHRLALTLYGLRPELVRPYVWYVQQHAPPDVHLECLLHERVALPPPRRAQ